MPESQDWFDISKFNVTHYISRVKEKNHKIISTGAKENGQNLTLIPNKK